MTQIRYVFFLEVVERDTLGHGSLCQVVGAETQAAEEGGSTGKHYGGLPGLRETLGQVNGVQGPRSVPHRII